MPSTERSRAVRFAAGALIALGLIAVWLLLRKHRPIAAAGVGGAAVLLMALALLVPPAALAVRTAWLTFGGALGWVNSRILLGVFFFVVLTPVALIRRLGNRRGARADTYWREPPAPRPVDHFEHPY